MHKLLNWLGYTSRHAPDTVWECHDPSRSRRFGCALYLPTDPRGWLVFSSGFGGSLLDYSRLALALRSLGWAVALVEHPGSDRSAAVRLLPERLLRPGPALGRKVHSPLSMRNRPADVGWLIGRLQRAFGVERLAVAGHSFGAYTALAVAGVPVEIEGRRYQFRDERVQAVAAISFQAPGRLFRPEALAELRVPALLMTGSRDHTSDGTRYQDRIRLAELLPGARCLVLAEVGHMDFADLGRFDVARRVASLLHDFLAGTEIGRT